MFYYNVQDREVAIDAGASEVSTSNGTGRQNQPDAIISTNFARDVVGGWRFWLVVGTYSLRSTDVVIECIGVELIH